MLMWIYKKEAQMKQWHFVPMRRKDQSTAEHYLGKEKKRGLPAARINNSQKL